MKKKLITVLLYGILMCLMSACGSSQSADSSSTFEEKSNSVEESIESTIQTSDSSLTAENSTIESDSDIFSHRIQIDGTDYTLPMNYKDCEAALIADGWSLDDESNGDAFDVPLDAYDGRYIFFTRGTEGFITVNLKNGTDEAISPEDGFVETIMSDTDSLDSAKVVFPGGLEFNSDLTADALVSQYGEPDEKRTKTKDHTGLIVYGNNYDDYISFEFSGMNDSSRVSFEVTKNPN